MNLFYAAFGSCRKSGGGKQQCYNKAKAVVKTYGRGGPREGQASRASSSGRRCKYGMTRKGKCHKKPVRSRSGRIPF